MAGPGNILIKVGADAGQAVRELSSLNSSLGDTMSASEKMGAGLRKAAVPAAAALAGIGFAAVDAAKAAADDQKAQAELARSLTATTGASKAQIAATESWIAAQSRATGVSDDELRPALEKIAVATGDVTSAQAYLKQAMDISAASGKSLETVSAAIAKAHEGQTTALAKLVPGLDEAAKKSKDFDTIMGALAQTTGGAAAAQAETAAGKFAIFNNQVGELKESLGAGLLPIMNQFAGVLLKVTDFASSHTKAITVLVGVIATFAAGILVANAALKAYEAIQLAVKVATAAWTAAQWLLNAALTANPIGAVIVAVGALVAALIVAYKKSETFRDIVNAALGAVKSAAQALAGAFQSILSAASSAFNWIVQHWQVALFAFGPLGAAIALLVGHFDAVKSAGETAFNAIKSAVDAVYGAINAVIGAIGSLLEYIKKIPSSIHLPHIPSPFLAPPAPGARARGAPAVASSSGATLTVNVYGAVDPEGTARAIRRILTSSDRRMGRL